MNSTSCSVIYFTVEHIFSSCWFCAIEVSFGKRIMLCSNFLTHIIYCHLKALQVIILKNMYSFYDQCTSVQAVYSV